MTDEGGKVMVVLVIDPNDFAVITTALCFAKEVDTREGKAEEYSAVREKLFRQVGMGNDRNSGS